MNRNRETSRRMRSTNWVTALLMTLWVALVSLAAGGIDSGGAPGVTRTGVEEMHAPGPIVAATPLPPAQAARPVSG